MKMKFNEESTKRIVKDYYKKHEDFDCDLEIICSVAEVPTPRSIVPTILPQLSFVLDGKLSINGAQEPVRTKVDNNDVKNALARMLEEEGYTVKEIEFDYDVKENDEKSAEFNGVVVDMSTKKKSKRRENGNKKF